MYNNNPYKKQNSKMAKNVRTKQEMNEFGYKLFLDKFDSY